MRPSPRRQARSSNPSGLGNVTTVDEEAQTARAAFFRITTKSRPGPVTSMRMLQPAFASLRPSVPAASQIGARSSHPIHAFMPPMIEMASIQTVWPPCRSAPPHGSDPCPKRQRQDPQPADPCPGGSAKARRQVSHSIEDHGEATLSDVASSLSVDPPPRPQGENSMVDYGIFFQQ
ncbi:hypothetical protein MAPG_06048 [Magnaporthiopsis poae ATCC 64411]|uniref:Uncharacterized protein n=1 Tax=Magnaporthiopsis poae (strain ATCC 64411 / 73-15) TaxID=644358 RepID=A0A0C4E104_MAGP6|nr:hypothetical protein MAPG_06048 [Magnaporthiopsis poae ATCC 64411]